MGQVGWWIAGMAQITAAALIWRGHHYHLDGEAIGPLKRVFRVNRAAFVLWAVIATGYSALVWVIPFVPVWYRFLIIVLCLVGLLTAIPVWNQWLRRLQRRRQVEGAEQSTQADRPRE